MSTVIPIAPQYIAPDAIHAQNIRVAFNLFRLVRLLRTNEPLTGRIFTGLQSLAISSALVVIACVEFNSRIVLATFLLILAAIILLCTVGAFSSPNQQDVMDLATQEDRLRNNYRKLVKAVFTDVVKTAQHNVQLSGNEPLHVQQKYELILQHAKATFEHKCAEAHQWTIERHP